MVELEVCIRDFHPQRPGIADVVDSNVMHPKRKVGLNPAYSPKSDRSGCVRLKAL